MNVGPPAPKACQSCPYRRDVPSGVWSPEEYAKLPAYDKPTPEQPHGVFLCHLTADRVCAGWAGCHDMNHSLGVRLAAVRGQMDGAAIQATLDYVSPVPLFASGAEAAAHGLADVDNPTPEATATVAKVIRTRSRKGRPTP